MLGRITVEEIKGYLGEIQDVLNRAYACTTGLIPDDPRANEAPIVLQWRNTVLDMVRELDPAQPADRSILAAYRALRESVNRFRDAASEESAGSGLDELVS